MKSLYLEQAFLILLILNFLCKKAEGQDNRNKGVKAVFITGITYDSKTLEVLSNTNFRINNKSGNSTNESGRFSFFGSPGDTVVFTYIGYRSAKLIVPDTLKSQEYVMGVFMQEQMVSLAEIIILPRVTLSSMIITPVPTDQKTMNIAQNNVDKAVFEGLTKSPKVYDADMNAKKAMRTNQMRTEYKGMLVTPENSVGLSTQSYRVYNVIFGSPISTPNRLAKEMITNSESEILLLNYEALKRSGPDSAEIDTIKR